MPNPFSSLERVELKEDNGERKSERRKLLVLWNKRVEVVFSVFHGFGVGGHICLDGTISWNSFVLSS